MLLLLLLALLGRAQGDSLNLTIWGNWTRLNHSLFPSSESTYLKLRVEQETNLLLSVHIMPATNNSCTDLESAKNWFQTMTRQATFVVPAEDFPEGLCLHVTEGGKSQHRHRNMAPDEGDQTWSTQLKVTLTENSSQLDYYLAISVILVIYLVFSVSFLVYW